MSFITDTSTQLNDSTLTSTFSGPLQPRIQQTQPQILILMLPVEYLIQHKT